MDDRSHANDESRVGLKKRKKAKRKKKKKKKKKKEMKISLHSKTLLSY